ncbi:MAG: LysM peptidoglycan-binding domain-containing protein, partial [Moraxellaceae bacterium]
MTTAAWRTGLLLGLVGLLLAGCAGKRPPPVVEERGRPPAASAASADASATEHVVAAGETLYAIALRYDKDYRELARINGINPQTFLIRPGQRLKLSGPPAVASTPAPARPTPPRAPAASSAPAATPTPAPAAAPAPSAHAGQAVVAKSQPSVSPPSGGGSPPARASTGLSWAWPAQGTLLSRFGAPGIAG